MKQKRFKKLLMAQGYSANSVRSLVDADAVTCEFKMAKIYPYAETYKRILEGRDFLV